jgi:hypothetical protein
MTEHTAGVTNLVPHGATEDVEVTEVTEVTTTPITPVARLGRGIRWRDLVAEMDRELADRELEDREAAA